MDSRTEELEKESKNRLDILANAWQEKEKEKDEQKQKEREIEKHEQNQIGFSESENKNIGASSIPAREVSKSMSSKFKTHLGKMNVGGDFDMNSKWQRISFRM